MFEFGRERKVKTLRIGQFMMLVIIAFSILLCAGIPALNRKMTEHFKPRFRVLAIYENGGHHVAYSAAARKWLNKLSNDSGFAID